MGSKVSGDSWFLFLDESGAKDLNPAVGKEHLTVAGILISAPAQDRLTREFANLKKHIFPGAKSPVFHAFEYFSGQPMGGPGDPIWPSSAAESFIAGTTVLLTGLRDQLFLLGCRVDKIGYLARRTSAIPLQRIASETGIPMSTWKDLLSAVRDGDIKKTGDKALHKLLQHLGYFCAFQGVVDLACKTLEGAGIPNGVECYIVADHPESEMPSTDPRSLEGKVGRWLNVARQGQHQYLHYVKRPPAFADDKDVEMLQLADLVTFLIADSLGTGDHDRWWVPLGPLLSPKRAWNCERSGIIDFKFPQL